MANSMSQNITDEIKCVSLDVAATSAIEKPEHPLPCTIITDHNTKKYQACQKSSPIKKFADFLKQV